MINLRIQEIKNATGNVTGYQVIDDTGTVVGKALTYNEALTFLINYFKGILEKLEKLNIKNNDTTEQLGLHQTLTSDQIETIESVLISKIQQTDILRRIPKASDLFENISKNSPELKSMENNTHNKSKQKS
ncbi:MULTISPECIES: hypothetical protein [Enterobacteriaceae]|uniref:hypothetical protein n=1 Tax=Enterobacteriaceae TaxID=543 RepID=UPI001FF6CB0C|nr:MULTISPECIES: hypothetical protein [Enterobacteriaceae]